MRARRQVRIFARAGTRRVVVDGKCARGPDARPAVPYRTKPTSRESRPGPGPTGRRRKEPEGGTPVLRVRMRAARRAVPRPDAAVFFSPPVRHVKTDRDRSAEAASGRRTQRPARFHRGSGYIYMCQRAAAAGSRRARLAVFRQAVSEANATGHGRSTGRAGGRVHESDREAPVPAVVYSERDMIRSDHGRALQILTAWICK